MISKNTPTPTCVGTSRPASWLKYFVQPITASVSPGFLEWRRTVGPPSGRMYQGCDSYSYRWCEKTHIIRITTFKIPPIRSHYQIKAPHLTTPILQNQLHLAGIYSAPFPSIVTYYTPPTKKTDISLIKSPKQIMGVIIHVHNHLGRCYFQNLLSKFGFKFEFFFILPTGCYFFKVRPAITISDYISTVNDVSIKYESLIITSLILELPFN